MFYHIIAAINVMVENFREFIYDETKFKYNQMAHTISCPNCGAPLGKLGEGNCQYCGTYIKPINLKGWYMVSYSEDYK